MSPAQATFSIFNYDAIDFAGNGCASVYRKDSIRNKRLKIGIFAKLTPLVLNLRMPIRTMKMSANNRFPLLTYSLRPCVHAVYPTRLPPVIASGVAPVLNFAIQILCRRNLCAKARNPSVHKNIMFGLKIIYRLRNYLSDKCG